MATNTSTRIGTAKRTKDGFEGSLELLRYKGPIQAFKIPESEKKAENAPDYIVYSNGIEIGSIKSKRARTSGKDYLAMKIHHVEIVGNQDLYANLAQDSQNADQFFLLA